MALLLSLFISFLQVGLFSVGGGYAAVPLIQDVIVNKNQLLSMLEFTDLITIAEMTPGPISINSATFVGQRVFGFWGAFVCTIAVITAPIIICLILAKLYYKYKNLGPVQTVLKAMRPAVVALIANAGLSILVLALFPKTIDFSTIKYLDLGLFIGSFIILRKFKLNAVTVILGSGVIGTLITVLTNGM